MSSLSLEQELQITKDTVMIWMERHNVTQDENLRLTLDNKNKDRLIAYLNERIQGLEKDLALAILPPEAAEDQEITEGEVK